jgi:hypothetical protein
MVGQDPYTEYQSEGEVIKAISTVTLPMRPDPFVDDEMWNLCLLIWKKARDKRPPMNVVFGKLTAMEQYALILSNNCTL